MPRGKRIAVQESQLLTREFTPWLLGVQISFKEVIEILAPVGDGTSMNYWESRETE